jgi:hypothetical protein
VALTEITAAIENETGAITVYRRFNKPALGPLVDSLADFVCASPVDQSLRRCPVSRPTRESEVAGIGMAGLSFRWHGKLF